MFQVKSIIQISRYNTNLPIVIILPDILDVTIRHVPPITINIIAVSRTVPENTIFYSLYETHKFEEKIMYFFYAFIQAPHIQRLYFSVYAHCVFVLVNTIVNVKQNNPSCNINFAFTVLLV